LQHFGKSKIGSLSARKGVSYPQLRLPQKCSDVIGDTADILETSLMKDKYKTYPNITVLPKERKLSKRSNIIKTAFS
jgi:hypothetical protein